MSFESDEIADEELLRDFVTTGNSDAMTRLVRRHESRVYGLAYRMLGNRADAADASQDAFVLLIRKARTFKGQSAFSTWLHRIVVNACHDLRRKASRVHEVTVTHVESHSAETDARIAERVDLERALSTLLEDQRDALILRDIIGLSYQEISVVTGVPLGTVKSRIARARVALAEILGNPVTEPSRLSEREP